MTIDWNKPVRTVKDKFPVKIKKYRGIIEGPDYSHSWDENGRNLQEDKNDFDLENVPEKKVGYVNGYSTGLGGVSHITRGDADQCSGEGRTACVRVEYEDGQFDE